MPAYPANGQSDMMSEAHEERIQTLEGSVKELVAASSAHTVKLENLAEKLDTNQGQVLDKLEEIAAGMNARLDRGAAQFEAHERALAEHRTDLNRLQAAHQARIKRWAFAKKMALPTLAAGTGVLLHKFGALLADWLVK